MRFALYIYTYVFVCNFFTFLIKEGKKVKTRGGSGERVVPKECTSIFCPSRIIPNILSHDDEPSKASTGAKFLSLDATPLDFSDVAYHSNFFADIPEIILNYI